MHTFYGRIKLTVALDNLFNYKPKYYYLNAPLTDGINLKGGIKHSDMTKRRFYAA